MVEAEKSLFEFASVIIGGHRLALVNWERARRARKCERPTCTRVQMVVVVVRRVMVIMLMTVMMIIDDGEDECDRDAPWCGPA